MERGEDKKNADEEKEKRTKIGRNVYEDEKQQEKE